MKPQRKNEDYMNNSNDQRIVRLETIIENINLSLSDIKKDLKTLDQDLKSNFKNINDRMWTSFLWLLSMVIGSTVGLATFMAHGFHWI